MTYTHPFITSRFVAYAGDTRTRALSMALRVIDGFTLDQPAASGLIVQLAPIPANRLIPIPRAVRGHSGVFCFEDVPAGNYTMTIETDPTTAPWFYLPPVPVTIPLPNLPDPTEPLLEIILTPNPAYPFPLDATLARGIVISNPTGPGVADAVVSTTYDQVNPNDEDLKVPVNVETLTDSKGQFVLFFKRLPAKTQNIIITSVKGGNQVQQQMTIVEGTMQMVVLPPLP